MVIKIPSSDVAADLSSSESLSLTGLVCLQEQYSKSKPPKPLDRKKTTKVSENDINFEFSYSAQSPLAVSLHKRTPSKDLFDLKLNQQSPAYGNVTLKDILEPRSRSRKSASNRESISRKKTSNKGIKYGSNIKEQNNGGFAQKLMQSITTPCRSCSAVEPSVRSC